MYEPLVHVLGGAARRTSRAADPELGGSGACYHAECHAALGDENVPVE